MFHRIKAPKLYMASNFSAMNVQCRFYGRIMSKGYLFYCINSKSQCLPRVEKFKEFNFLCIRIRYYN